MYKNIRIPISVFPCQQISSWVKQIFHACAVYIAVSVRFLFQKPCRSGCIMGYDPINLNTGNFIYEKEDLIIYGITKLSFHLTYFSMGENQAGSIGKGWHHNYEIFVEEKDAGILCLHLGDGQIAMCKRTLGDLYALAGATGLLKKETDGYRN